MSLVTIRVFQRGQALEQMTVEARCGVTVWEPSGMNSWLDGLAFHFEVVDPTVKVPPPRELEALSTADVADYLAQRIRDDAEALGAAVRGE